MIFFLELDASVKIRVFGSTYFFGPSFGDVNPLRHIPDLDSNPKFYMRDMIRR